MQKMKTELNNSDQVTMCRRVLNIYVRRLSECKRILITSSSAYVNSLNSFVIF